MQTRGVSVLSATSPPRVFPRKSRHTKAPACTADTVEPAVSSEEEFDATIFEGAHFIA